MKSIIMNILGVSWDLGGKGREKAGKCRPKVQQIDLKLNLPRYLVSALCVMIL